MTYECLYLLFQLLFNRYSAKFSLRKVLGVEMDPLYIGRHPQVSSSKVKCLVQHIKTHILGFPKFFLVGFANLPKYRHLNY